MDVKPEAVLEVVGTLAVLCLPGFDWQSYLSRNGLEYWLSARLVAGNVDDDIALECVMLCGSACDEGSAPLLADAGIVRVTSLACILSISMPCGWKGSWHGGAGASLGRPTGGAPP